MILHDSATTIIPRANQRDKRYSDGNMGFRNTCPSRDYLREHRICFNRQQFRHGTEGFRHAFSHDCHWQGILF